MSSRIGTILSHLSHDAAVARIAICFGAMMMWPVSFSQGQISSGSAVQPRVQPPEDRSDYDSDPKLERKLLRMFNEQRQKSIVADTEKLLRLASELNQEIAVKNAGAITEAQLSRVAQIEKLAKSVRERMKYTMGDDSTIRHPFPLSVH